MSLIRRLKYRFSPVYRIKQGGGLSAIRTEKEVEAVVDFCRDELKDKEHMKLNPDRKRIYEMTVKLYKQNQSNNSKVSFKYHEFKPTQSESMYNNVQRFINDHTGWYWS